MDLDIARWILEFLLRQPINDGLLNRALSTLPLSNSDLHLKKTILLRTIESKISKGSVSEKILELLEIIAEMDKREGIVVSESMKAAYCAVAVNCTVRFLEENCNEQGEYFNTVKRIWRGRIGTMEKFEEAVLISDELLTWRDDLEAAIWDSNVYQNVSKRDTRNEALKAVRVYVDEAWKAIGPTFLELAAQTMGKSVEKGQRMGKDPVYDQVGNMVTCGDLGVSNRCPEREKDHRAACSNITSCELAVDNSNTMRDKDQIGKQATTSGQDFDVGVRSPGRDKEQVEEGAGTLSEVAVSDRNQDKEQVENGAETLPEVALSGGSQDREQVEEGADTLPNLSLGDRNQVEERGPTLSDVGEDLRAIDKPAMRDKNQAGERSDSSPRVSAVRDKDVHKGNVLPEPKHVGGRGRRRGVKIVDTEELGMETSSNTYDCIPTPEVDKVCETLKTSCMDLQAVVKDPLPDALLMAETVRSDLARKNMIHESSVENRNEDAADHLSDKSVEPARLNNGKHGNHCSRRGPSLMERNTTARTYEWDDSIDNLPDEGTSRFHLPSPKRKAVSPLKKYESKKNIRRRKIKKWSVLEEDTLRTGVSKFGRGNWKLILNAYRDIFEERTEVDLKDKWRNLTR